MKGILFVIYRLITSYKIKEEMIEDFDSLYNKFFGKRNKRSEDPKIRDAQNLVDRLNNFDDLNIDGFNPYENDLGDPDSIIRFKENGYTFERKIWNREGGQVVSVEMVGSPMDTGFDREPRNIPLNEKLEIAISDENYELAAEIRDEIKALVESKTPSEHIDNKGIPNKE